ncbi:hypothetical protein MTO96_035049 [Rhipicephalus appendiculatus]
MRLRHEQAQRLCRAVSTQPAPRTLSATTSNAMCEFAEQPTSGAVCLATVGAASLATLPAVGILGTAGELPTTTAYTSDVLLRGDRAAASGLQCAPLLEPQNVPLPQGSDSEDMDTTTTRKRLRPSEPGSDDEGASRKLQAVGLAQTSELTPNSHSRVAGLTEHPLATATDSTNEGEFQQVLSKAQKRRQRAAIPQGIAGNNAPPPGIGPASTSASPPPVSGRSTGATSVMAPAAITGTPATSVPTPPPTACTVLFRPAHNGAAFPRTSRLAIAQALSSMPGVKEVRVNMKKNIVAADAASPEWAERLLATSEIIGMPVIARLPADRSQSSGVVHGNYADDDLLANASSEAVLRAAPSSGGAAGSSSPQASLAGGKTYAAVLGAPVTEITNSTNDPLQAPLQQRGRQANAKKRGCAKPPSLQKEALHSASNEENKNLRLLLRVVADLLPPDSHQLRSICLQAGGAPLPSSKHG